MTLQENVMLVIAPERVLRGGGGYVLEPPGYKSAGTVPLTLSFMALFFEGGGGGCG